MKKIFKITVLVLVLAFIVMQFIRPDRTNPPVNAAESLRASAELPEDVGNIITRSCSDCHTNETVYPWYSNISPFSWLLAGHIEDGRKELNFSVWNTYSPRKKRKKLEEVCEQLEEKVMPLPSYLWIHHGAALTESQSKRLCDWANEEKARIPE